MADAELDELVGGLRLQVCPQGDAYPWEKRAAEGSSRLSRQPKRKFFSDRGFFSGHAKPQQGACFNCPPEQPEKAFSSPAWWHWHWWHRPPHGFRFGSGFPSALRAIGTVFGHDSAITASRSRRLCPKYIVAVMSHKAACVV